ncbi:signal peptide peptidase SppA [soil metagenome]
MKLVRGAWKLLVGIKDGLVLIAMLIFFGLLFAALSARPNAAAIRDGALVLDLDGIVTEQPANPDPFAFASGGGNAAKEIRLRDVVRSLDAAKDDDRVKAVVIDLDSFGGGYPSAVAEVARAVGRVRASGKKVLTYATAYTDSGYMIASNASEIWLNPMGGILFSGPGGSQLYYKGLIDKLGVNVHVYRVGKFKSYVEPYTRSEQSPESKEAMTALYGSLFGQWQEAVAKARPQAKFQPFLTSPAAVIAAAQGDFAKANLQYGLVDKLGDKLAFGKRIAEIAGEGNSKLAGDYRRIKFADYVDAHPLSRSGDAIGVLTVAGDIVDGKGGAGTAAGDTLTKALLDGLAKKNLKALVIRVDSPGGSALASEQIRQAILQAKAQKLPVVVSMGSLAASGGYWVSTAGDVIFAEPNTITGSIGIFGIIPTFEKTLAKLGVAADGVKTTPLTGQPDVYGGTNAEVDSILQAGIEHGYREFVERVSAARHLTPQRVDEIGQGRVWDGGTARQIGLVDRFGGLDDAIAEAAKRAGLDPKDVHAEYLEKKPSFLQGLFRDIGNDDDANTAGADIYSHMAANRRAVFAQVLGDARRLGRGSAIQARCLECAGLGGVAPARADVRLMDLLIDRLTQ